MVPFVKEGSRGSSARSQHLVCGEERLSRKAGRSASKGTRRGVRSRKSQSAALEVRVWGR